MTITGLVQDVSRVTLGSELVDAAVVGANVLTVDDVIVFAEGGLVPFVDEATGASDPEDETVVHGGGLLRIGGDDPNAEIRRYVSLSEPDDDDDADDEGDPADVASYGIGGGYGGAREWDTPAMDATPADALDDVDEDEIPVGPSTIYLAPTDPDDPYSGPLAHAWPIGTRVDVWDAGTESTASQWRALVRAAGDPLNTDAIDCVIAFPLVPLLPEGVRTHDTGELVIIDDETGEWRVVDVTGRTPGLAGFPTMRVYTYTGSGYNTTSSPAFRTGTWTKPESLSAIRVRGVAGGGGGGAGQGGNGSRAAGGGGGGGGYFERWYAAADLPDTVAWQVGAGGGRGTMASGDSPWAGAATTWMAMTANPGQPGANANAYTGGSIQTMYGGTGGTAVGGQINITGGAGFPSAFTNSAIINAGQGGQSAIGTTTRAPIFIENPGYDGTPYGGGGSGAASGANNNPGGYGSHGVLIVEEFYT